MTNKSFLYLATRYLRVLLALWGFVSGAPAADEVKRNPLEPIDTSSPRGTLQGFLRFTDEAYHQSTGRLGEYLASHRLYLTPEEVASVNRSYDLIRLAERAIDFSELPPAMSEESSRRLTVQLKDVLDHLDLPPPEAIPDAKEMAAASFKRWTIPGTEIRIAQAEKGPRAGEYLFDPETVRGLPDFYERVKELPYKPGVTGGWYESIAYTPAGLAFPLHWVIPTRWIFGVPSWMVSVRFLDQPVWRWIGIGVVLGVGLLAVILCFRLSRRWAVRAAPPGRRWANLLKPISLVIVTPLAALALAKVLRISGSVYEAVTLSLWGLFFLSLAWAVWAAGGAVAESVIGAERLRQISIDSQLIRLVVRLVTIIMAIAILIVGGDRVGLPAYSVVAGLGVGGLAVALAAQQTLANLLGSLIIMFERPFGIGHSIKVQDAEGIVEGVGFRSTRIRTPDNSLVTIPSSQLVSNAIENRQLREYRRVNTTLNLANDTSLQKIKNLLHEIEQILRDHPDIRKDNIYVVLYEIGTGGPDILVNFFLKVPDKATELRDRQMIFMDILGSAEAQDIKFR
ncbi:MAG TPA: mechanosensitive ion channel family protein [Terriglobales bacterium]|nr:mechanosensitive ion channel family protein [Terriglobales bacterium]